MATILIVDDNRSSREFLMTLLGYSGHRLLEAEDGAQAQELARLEHPDLIITDILMPVMDGYVLARQLREDPALEGTPVIFYTATYQAREARALANAAGVQHVLSKPAEPQAILDLVNRALSKAPLPVPHAEIITKQLLDPLQAVSAKLTAKMGELGGLNQRLSQLVALGIEIGAERNPRLLLEKFCERARNILNAEFAAVGILANDGQTLQHFITSGIDPETVTRLGTPPTGKGILGILLNEHQPIRLRDLTSDPRSVGFPPGHPVMRSFLGVAIETSMQKYGNLYLTNKIGTEEFSEEDEQLVHTLASQVAVAYENAYLYHDIQSHAARLQLEMFERQHAEAELRARDALLNKTQLISHVGSWELDLVTNRLAWSDEVYRIFGLDVQEFAGTYEAVLEAVHPDDRAAVDHAYSESVRNGETGFNIEHRIVRRNTGEIRYIYEKCEHERDGSGRIVRSVGMVQDITESKQAEASLAASEERFRALLEHSPAAVAVNAPDGTVLYVSPAVERITGIRAEVGNKVNPFGQIHSEDVGLSQEMLGQILAVPGATETVQFRIRHPDGSWRWLDVISTNLIEDPSVGGIVSNFADITARKLAEEALTASEKRFRALVENAPDGIALLGMDGKLQQVTPSTEQILGYTLDDATGQDPALLTHPEDLPALLALLGDLIQTPGKIATAQYRFRHKDGSWRWLESTISNLVAEPSVEAIVFNYRDITANRQAEEQIRRQVKRLNALRMIDIAISSSFDLHVILDVVLREVCSQLGVDASAVLLFNTRLQSVEYAASRGFHSEALHFTRLKLGEGFAGRVVLERKTIHISDLMETGGRLAQALQLEQESFIEYYGTPLMVKGEVKGVLEIYQRSLLKAEPEWLEFLETLAGEAAIAIDNAGLFTSLQRTNAELEQRVSERTEELHQTNAELEFANHAKDEFLANMSHELRTPLNSILGLSESLLEERRGALNDYQQRSLKLIASSGHHLLELINDILDLSKIEAGMLEFYPQPILVDEFCNSCLAFINTQAIKKSITVTYTNEATVAKLFADPRRLKQIVINLLTNAVKFTLAGGHVTLQVQYAAEQDLIQFSVIDDGIGIAREHLQRLFQPFVQLDSSLNRQYEGTGLGLALVHKLTDLHGGSVSVESEPGKGSRFTINLPCRQDRIKELEQLQPALLFTEPQEKAEAPLEPSMLHGVILLAEDKAANIMTIGDYLENYGFEVVVAHDGLEAIEKAEAIKPDLILMDIQMPVLDGLEAMAHLRRDPAFKSTPIIALTALAMPGDRERCLEAGANEYMSKPVSLKMLRQTIEGLL